MPIDHDRVEATFSAAIAIGGLADRAHYLDGACGNDALLRERVEALLASHDATDSFMARPPHRPGPLAEGPGARIGRYKLLQLIGEGGFGSVFMAEQEHPVRRKVALKIIKLGMDTRQVIARFEAERQALAMMDHPNIARVFDAGATDTGRPYFVMELVRGVPITEYCDTNNMTTRERLELLLPVCHAVQHAHLKGIIHRDIKPSNILVTMADGNPIPKVIDFGIAKATSARLTEMTLFTEFRQLVGTPEYMSPEQAEMSGIDVDTRTDVYSLGVLLYELLTGTTPFDPRELRSKAYGEIQRMIRDIEPPRPSTRISTLGATLAAVAAHRRIEPRKLGQLMRGELDCIVMKAMEKDRTRRYETASALAADVRHHLENEPVSARPASTPYRLRKFASKHKVGFAAVAAVAATLVLGIIGTSAGLVRAQRQADRATAVSGFLQSVLASARPDVVGGGKDAKVVDLLQSAESMIEKELADQPDAQIQTHYTLYFTYMSLGLPDEARMNLSRAYAVIKQSGNADSELGVRIALHTARLDRWAGLPLDLCERMARTATERAKRLLGEEHETTLFAYGILGQICNDTGRTAEADSYFRRLEEGVRRLKSRRMAEPALAATLADYAWVLRTRGEYARSEALNREALKLAIAAKHRILGVEVRASGDLAEALRSQEKWAEMAEVYEHALAELRPRMDDSQLAGMMTKYAQVLRRLGRGEEAANVQRQAYAAMAGLAAAPAHTPAQLIRRAELRIRVRKFNEAAADSARAIELDPTQFRPWYYRGCLLAYTGDEPAYRAHCDAMLKRFDRHGPREVERTAKTSLLLAGTPHLTRLSAVLDRALAVDAGDNRAWDQLAKAMAAYRGGQFDACIDEAGKAAAGLHQHDEPGESTAKLFSAMALHRLGQHEKARIMLDDVVRWAEEELADDHHTLGGDQNVENWLILHVALREAKALIDDDPAKNTGEK